MGGLQLRIGLVPGVAVAVLLERGRLGSQMDPRSRVDGSLRSGIFVDVVAEPDHEIGVLLGDVAVRRVVAAGVVLATGHGELRLGHRDRGIGRRTGRADRTDVLADAKAVVPHAWVERHDSVNTVPSLGSGDLRTTGKHRAELGSVADLPRHRDVVLGHAATVERVGRESRPQHDADRIWIPRGDSDGERVGRQHDGCERRGRRRSCRRRARNGRRHGAGAGRHRAGRRRRRTLLGGAGGGHDRHPGGQERSTRDQLHPLSLPA